jgi:hypothetical protein
LFLRDATPSMSNPTQPACREWLGLEPAELPFPHRVLGVSVDERDTLTIVRAADRRLAMLRDVPAERAAERDALTAQVEAARDAMLAVAVRPPVPGPVTTPAPPPTPPAVPFPQAQETAAEAAFPVVRRPVVHRRRSGGSASALTTAALVLAIAGLALYIGWPHLKRALQVAERPQPDPRPAAAPPLPPGPWPEPHPEPRPEPQPEPGRESQPEPGREPQPEPQRDPSPEPQPEPTPAPAQVERVRELVEAAVTRAFAALRQQDYDAANGELDAVAETANEDEESAARLNRWNLLVQYARQYPDIRVQAMTEAEASTFEDGPRVISVVGITNDMLVYRDSLDPGRNLRFPLDQVPADVERIVVRAWLDAGGRAANHLFLGAAALARPTPDLEEARRDWRAAAAKGEDQGKLLLDILEDPAIRHAPAAR